MLFKAPELLVDEDKPFDNCKLGRVTSGETLTALLQSASDEPLVLSINAPWGDGKTTFLRMWTAQLKKNGFKTLSFSAWENDFTDDAFVALMAELSLGFSDAADEAADSETKTYIGQLKKYGGGFIKRALPAAIKITTGIAIDEEALKGIGELLEKEAAQQIAEYEQSKKSVAHFKTALSNLASKVYEKTQYPLVILIDELDRCKPTYAIKVLEAVKHFFSVENIVFVLALDRKQLGHSIKSVYGAEFDVDGYLRRFIDIEFNLPPKPKNNFCREQFNRFGISEYLNSNTGNPMRPGIDDLQNFLGQLLHTMELTLREQERCITHVCLAIKTGKTRHISLELLALLIVLKINKEALYKSFAAYRGASTEVLNYIGKFQNGSDFLSSEDGTWIKGLLIGVCDDESTRLHYLETLEAIIVSPNSSRRNIALATIEKRAIEQYSNLPKAQFIRQHIENIDLITNFRL